ncbi:hypothetical protein Q8A73_002951 [Channa argus]|nr:hypothetical protein Q8A73_002951 [Channa argus]
MDAVNMVWSQQFRVRELGSELPCLSLVLGDVQLLNRRGVCPCLQGLVDLCICDKVCLLQGGRTSSKWGGGFFSTLISQKSFQTEENHGLRASPASPHVSSCPLYCTWLVSTSPPLSGHLPCLSWDI